MEEIDDHAKFNSKVNTKDERTRTRTRSRHGTGNKGDGRGESTGIMLLVIGTDLIG